MKNHRQFDAIVVGAGPAGSTAAMVMAQKGLNVVLIERGEYAGAKNVSGGALYDTRLLERLYPGFHKTAAIERHISRRVLGFISTDHLLTMDFRCDHFSKAPYSGYTVIRPKLDQWIAQKAQDAGALLLTDTVVDGLIKEDGRVKGVYTRCAEGALYANVVIAADGVNSLLAKQAGLQRTFEAHEISLGVKEIIEFGRAKIDERFQLNANEGAAYEIVGSATKNVNGGAFLYTNGSSISIGVIAQLSSLAEKKEKTYEMLEEFKAHRSIRPLIRGGIVKEYSAHLIPEGGWKMFPRLYAPGLLVAGDAAGFVLVTGYYLQGMNYAMASGEAAAKAAVQAIEDHDYSESSMARYEKILNKNHMLSEFKTFQRTPHFLNNERIQNVYPELVCQTAQHIMQCSERKQKLGRQISTVLKKSSVSWRNILRDIYESGRAIGW